MDRDINKYITVIRQKNGKIRITHDISNEANIYKLLFDLGFRKSRLDNKSLYFRIKGETLEPVAIHHIRNAFYQLLKNYEFENIPNDINYIDISNWYLSKQPIKQNGLLDHYLNTELNEQQKHILKLKTDLGYRNKHEYKAKSAGQ